MKKILLAFSWGHQFPRPGLSNEAMAREIQKIKSDFDYIVVQAEIGQALEIYGTKPDYIVGQPRFYLNTYEVATAMLRWMTDNIQELPKANIHVLCHEAHWGGCKMILRKLKIRASRVPIDIPYDRNSRQWYTRGPLRAFIGTILRAVEYFLRGELF